MARPQKAGIDYFPLDVDMDRDDKIQLIEAEHGVMGFGIIIKLLMKIYAEGYCYHWTEKEQLLFSRRVNVDINGVNAVINSSLKWGMFDNDTYEKHQILTSSGIQKRYIAATSRRKDVRMIREYTLIDTSNAPNIVIVDINGVNVDINPSQDGFVSEETPQSKVKESKVKESTVKESKGETTVETLSSTPHQVIRELFNNICISYPKVTVIGTTRQKHLKARWEQFNGDLSVFETAFKKLEASGFCKGENNRKWRASFDWIIQNDGNMAKVLEGKYDDRDQKPKRGKYDDFVVNR